MKKILMILTLFLLLVACQGETNSPVEKLIIVGENEMEVGDVIKLITNISSTVNWFSSDSSIATVSGGFVTAYKEGVVTITAEKASNILVFDTFDITISAKEIKFDEEEIIYLQTKILSIDKINKKIELLNCSATTYTEKTKFVKVVDGKMSIIDLDDFYIGMDNIYVAYDNISKTIKTLMMEGQMGFKNIRVGIRRTISDFTNEETLYHDTISLYFPDDANAQIYDGSYKADIDAGSTLTISISNGKISVKNKGNVIIDTYHRVIFSSPLDEVTITSISRSSGNPKYAGNIEVAIKKGRLVVVNDVDIEDYLIKVVPSEMPVSYHVEALKAQAIAARTYAYMDIFNKTNDDLGYTVDDSVKSQVYNNINAQAASTAAVEATAGLIMTHDGQAVQAYFYSTSSGLTASAHEVWITEGEEGDYVPYLIGHNLTKDANGETIYFDYQDEASVLNFFKTIKMETPDAGISYHRWRLTLTNQNITDMLKANLASTYNAYPNLILTKVNGEWKSQSIPSNIGTVNNMYVEKRGESGVIISLIIETSTMTFKLINQYTIRFTLRPSSAGRIIVNGATNTSNNYTQTWNSPGNLYSGFFAIENNGDSYTLYGGGNGHGVGMSQNGANGLAKAGSSFVEILTSYYSAIDLTDISYELVVAEDYIDLLKFANNIS